MYIGMYTKDQKISSAGPINNKFMTAKEIVIKLIDEHKISGEEAICLIEAIVKDNSTATPIITPYTESPWTTTPKWDKYEITCSNDAFRPCK